MSVFTNNIKLSDVQVTSMEPIYTNQSWTGVIHTRSTGIQYYTIQFTMQFEKKYLQEYNAFIAQYSQGAPFNLSLGFYGNYLGTQTKSIQATAARAKGSYQIPVASGYTVEVGTLIQFSNHKKIYRVISNANNVLSIFPDLRQNVVIGEIIKYKGIEGQFMLNPDNDYSLTVANAMSIQLKATEYLQ